MAELKYDGEELEQKADNFAFRQSQQVDGEEYAAWYALFEQEEENAVNFRYLGTYRDDADYIATEAQNQGCPDWVMIDYDRTSIGFFQGTERVSTPFGCAYFGK